MTLKELVLNDSDRLDSINVKVTGQYYSSLGRVKQVNHYEIDLPLPRKAIPFALQYIQHFLINKALSKIDPQSLGFRTCEIVSHLPAYIDPEAEEISLDDEFELEDIQSLQDEKDPLSDLITETDEPILDDVMENFAGTVKSKPTRKSK